jgi:hypothetical protein
MMLYLLVKEHNLTGLKYLCKKSARSGIFGSIREASRQIEGYTYKMIWDRLHNDTQWRYLKSL